MLLLHRCLEARSFSFSQLKYQENFQRNVSILETRHHISIIWFFHPHVVHTNTRLVHRRILEYLERSPRRIRHVRSVSSSQCSVDHLPPPASTLGMDLGWHGVAWLCVWGAGQLNDTCTILRSWGTKWKRWDATVECMTILPLDTESTPVTKWEKFGFATFQKPTTYGQRGLGGRHVKSTGRLAVPWKQGGQARLVFKTRRSGGKQKHSD